MGFTFNNKRYRIIKVNPRKIYSFQSTGTPTYRPINGNENPDLIDFFVTNGYFPTYVHRHTFKL
jgi:predicted CoA-binding protein